MARRNWMYSPRPCTEWSRAVSSELFERKLNIKTPILNSIPNKPNTLNPRRGKTANFSTRQHHTMNNYISKDSLRPTTLVSSSNINITSIFVTLIQLI